MDDIQCPIQASIIYEDVQCIIILSCNYVKGVGNEPEACMVSWLLVEAGNVHMGKGRNLHFFYRNYLNNNEIVKRPDRKK